VFTNQRFYEFADTGPTGANINRNKELEAKSLKEVRHRSGPVKQKFG